VEIKKIMVVGSGLMGGGIAQVCAQAGFEVWLNDVAKESLDKAMASIEWSLNKLVNKGILKESTETIINRINPMLEITAGKHVDLAIEAVFEDRELKQNLFRQLDRICDQETLFASNTSAIPITGLAAVTQRAEKFMGLHFFSPVPMMQAVEVIRGTATSNETLRQGMAFVRSIGKEPIQVNRDVGGFVINRINFPSAIEAMRLVEAGVASVADIDKGLRLAAGRKMGIFETGDMVGLDVTYGALMSMYEETGDSRWFPPLLLRRKVKAGHLGRKTGKGWYTYDSNGSKIL
jgi:3-hydroxybutyryl-CoA dehydrogenase